MGGKPPYLLYLWHELEFNDLLRYSVNRIDPSIAGLDGAGGVPSVLGNGSGKKNKRGDEVGMLAKSINDLSRRNEEATRMEMNTTKWQFSEIPTSS